MIIDGYVNWAIQAPGVHDKIYTQPNSGEMIAMHSIVGPWTAAVDRFMSRQKTADGRYTKYAAASVMFILAYDGTLYQLYDVNASTWTSGSREANTRSWAIELEGGQVGNESEPMTPQQVASFVRLVREWEVHTGRQAIVAGTGRNLLQHKELVALHGGGATACASDRYTLGLRALAEDDMTPVEVQQEIAKYMAAFPPVDKRLREATQKRMDLVALAAGSIGPMEEAHDILLTGGFFDDAD